MEKENYQEYFTTLDKLIELLTKMKIRQNQSRHDSFIGVSFLGGKKSKDCSQEYYTILSGNPDKDPDFDLMKRHLYNLKDLLSEQTSKGMKVESSPAFRIEENMVPRPIIPEELNQSVEDDEPRPNHIVDGKVLQTTEEENLYSNPLPITPLKSDQAEESDEIPPIPIESRSNLQYPEDVHADELSPNIKVYIDQIFNTYDKHLNEKIDEKLKEFKKNIDSILQDYVTKDLLLQEIQLIKRVQEKMRTEMIGELSNRAVLSKEDRKRESVRVFPDQRHSANNDIAALLSKSNIRSGTSSDTIRERKPSINNETRMAMHELANEYNSAYKNTTDGKHLNLKTEYARAWASGGRSFQSEEEAKKIPLVEFQGNYTYLAVEAEEDKYYLMPRKGMKLTPGLIQHAAYDQFFAYDLPEGSRELKIHLDEPAIVEKRGDEYYLVRRGSISF